jgi:AraC-like DNA-binding protein
MRAPYAALSKLCPKLSGVDAADSEGQDLRVLVQSASMPELSVSIARGRSALTVTARSVRAPDELLVEMTFSGGPDGIWFRLVECGVERTFRREELARHPALSAVLRLVADEVELAKPASEALLVELVRALLVYVARVETTVPLPHWGRPFRDTRVEKALAVLNADIEKRWTVELLARKVGLSRPTLARKFQRVLGLSPMRYLTERRMQLAALLLGTDSGLAEVATRVGYRSEFAFNRAFKRHHSVPPGVYRRTAAVAFAGLGGGVGVGVGAGVGRMAA